MPMKYTSNAFSLNMLAVKTATIKTRPVTLAEAARFASDAYSCVGHADTAAVMAAELGVPIDCNRVTLQLQGGDQLLVGQYSGPRLEEGCKDLPEGSKIEWVLLQV